MTYIEWVDELKGYLLDMPQAERQQVLAYFAEMYADKRDAGLEEKEIIKEFGAPYDVAVKILQEEKPVGDFKAKNGSAVGETTYLQKSDGQRASNKKKKKKDKGKLKGAFKAILITVIAIIAVCAAVNVILYFALKPDFEMREERQNADAINKVYIENLPGTVNVEFYDGDEIIIEYPYSSKIGYSVSQTGGVLKIVPSKNNYIWYSWDVPQTEVKIPNEIELDFEADLDAGTLTVGSGKFKNVKIDLDAGEVELDEIGCLKADVSVDAGSLHAQSLICHDAKIDLDAGEVNLEYLECDKLTVDLDAGEVDINRAVIFNVEANVDVGTVKINLIGVDDEYTVSGIVNVGGFNLPTQYGTDGSKSINVKVNVGSVWIFFTDK